MIVMKRMGGVQVEGLGVNPDLRRNCMRLRPTPRFHEVVHSLFPLTKNLLHFKNLRKQISSHC